MQTVTLLRSIDEGRHDARVRRRPSRRGEARAKERVFSFRDEFGQWDPKNQRPELWNIYNGRHAAGEHIRVFPLSNWTELDIWQYILEEEIPLPPIYFAHRRQVFRRDGMLLAVNPHTPLNPGEEPFEALVRFRPSATPRARVASSRRPRRRRRSWPRWRRPGSPSVRDAADDRISEAGMEDRKKEGYF